jgi:hypothetical protein
MNSNKLNIQIKLLAMALIILFAACQKLDRPGDLGDFPRDTNPPGGPLKFYTAFEGQSSDSVKASIGIDSNVTYVDGVSGKAFSGGPNSFSMFKSINDFTKATSFTVSFWIKRAGPNPAGGGTAFVFGVPTSANDDPGQDMFFFFEDAGNPSSSALAAAKFHLNGQWFEFTGDKWLPNVLNGQWHQLALTLDETNSTLKTYIDGQEFTNLPAGFGTFTKNSGKADFSKATGLVIGGPGQYAVEKKPADWMKPFNGQIDQFRMYDKVLTAAEINQLFTSKL